MDFEKLADKFIEEGGWQGSPRIAIELFAKWLAEQEAAQQSVQPTSACCRAEIIPGIRHGEPSLCANCGGTCGLRKPLGAL